ncbi:MAG: phospholipid carrier-dependent glycosyltransferase [Candidatus Sericytochromatia bacterium]|nr:phospholipid carrier-dependent glycosyltransferase [Candidatus Tanganyikabacteria bacterium]
MNEAVPAPPPATGAGGRLARWREAARRNPREWFANWLTAALILRLVLVALPVGFWIDIGSFQAWSNKLAEAGPTKFYESIWSDYPPAYMYVLWVLGLIYQGLNWGIGGVFTVLGMAAPALGGLHVFLVKLPGVACDILNAWLIFKILEGRVSQRTAYRAALAYAFNPITLFISAIWGQMDAVLLSAMLAAVYMMLKGRLIPCILLTALAVLIKPQGLFLIPAIVVTQWWRHRPANWAMGITGGLLLGWLLILPFTAFSTKYPGLLGPVTFMWEKMQATAGTYPYSSVNAFNLWMPTKMWQPDDRKFFFLTHREVGLLLLGGTVALTAWAAFRQRLQLRASRVMLIFAIILLACFLLPTRMHERYLFPAVAMLALAAACNRNLRWNYWAFSVTALLNVMYAFFLYNTPKGLEGAWTPIKSYMETLWGLEMVMLNMWVFGDLIGTLVSGPAQEPERKWWQPAWAALIQARDWVRERSAIAWEKADWLHMGAISGAFFLLGVWNLYTPNEQIFDEVYHARTAKEFIDGTNPYEWTHPHLGKLFVAGGILLMNRVNGVLGAIGVRKFDPTASPPAGSVPVGAFDGFDGFGWRIASLVIGALVLCALYVLARRMFRSRPIATVAAGLLALDGVFWVQSRVAMTNIYITFFLLVGCIGLWEYCSRISYREDGERTTVHHFRAELWLLLWGVGIGGALASRWSSLFAWGIGFGIIGLHWLVARRKWLRAGGTALFVPRLLIYVVAVPVLIYVASYIPWFLQKGDHTLAELWQMQKNMWGYHAGMVATHNYQSPWWTWPFMHRPTWYYFHDWKNGTVSGIVAIGNPAVWWVYVPVFGLLAYHLWRTRDWRLAFLLAFGTGLWFAWGVQPRKLVFMHYLFEAIPFLCMGIAYLISRLFESRETRPVAWTYLAVAAGLFVFWYPLLTAIPVPWAFYSAHIWVSPFWY